MSCEPVYRRELSRLRRGFPAPRPDQAADEWFERQLAGAVREVLRLRGSGARLGRSSGNTGDARAGAATQLPLSTSELDEVVAGLVAALQGMPFEGHPRGQVNVNGQPSTLGLVGTLLPAIFNPNLSSDGRGAGCSDAERAVAAMMSSLVGFDPRVAGGVFTFGGAGTLLYGVKLGLERACPGTMRRGIREDTVVLTSEFSHHTCLTAASWLGIGSDQVRRVPVRQDHSVDVERLGEVARDELRAGRRIAAMIATMGTTDAFGLDDLAALAALRDELMREFQLDYRPWLHADAVIGWAWAALNDYDVTANPLSFSPEVLQGLAGIRPRLRALSLVDSLGVDFHKTGFVPYVSSLVLVREFQEFQRLARPPELMPYLFHDGSYHPGLFTLETTRAAGGVLAAWANLRWLGLAGLQVLLGHALEMTVTLRRQLSALPGVAVVNDANCGPVSLYRVYPSDVPGPAQLAVERGDAAARVAVERVNDFNRRVHAATRSHAPDDAAPAIGLTTAAARTACGLPLAALKSYLLSPWLEAGDLEAIVRQVAQCRALVRGSHGVPAPYADD